MTVTTTTPRVQHSGDGVTQVFTVPFYFLDGADLGVYLGETKQTLTTDYTVSNAGNPAGGSITMLSAPSSGVLITVIREPEQKQETDYPNNDPFPAETHERVADRAMMIAQHLQDQINRSLKVPVTETGVEFPAGESNKLIGWNAAGDSLENRSPAPLLELTQPTEFPDRAAIEAATIDGSVTWLRTAGWTSSGDGRAAVLARRVSEPVSSDKVQSDDGAWWEVVEPAYTAEGGDTARELPAKLGDVVTALDAGAVGDASTDDTAAFTALEGSVTGRRVDLLGQTYSVTSIPTGNLYVNGWWLVPNDDESASVRYPAYETIDGHSLKIETGRRYSAWPQDSACAYNGAVLIGYNEGSDHLAADLHHVIATSLDGARSVHRFERGMEGFLSPLGARMCFAAGVLDGQELRVVRQNTGDAASGGTHRLYGRRRFEVREVDALLLTPGTDSIVVGYANHGVKVGDSVTFAEWDGGAVGGVDPAGNTYTVATVAAASFSLTVAGTTATGAVTDRGKLQFEQGAFANLDVDSGTLGAAIIAASADISSSPTLIHSLAPVPGSAGTLYIGFHGGGASGPFIARIDDALTGSATIAWVRRVQATLTEGVEPTVAYDATSGDILGFVRSQGSGYPIRFWRSDDDLATDATVADCPWGNDFGTYSPIPCRIVGSDLHFALTSKRTRDGKRGTVPLYWGRVPLADADNGIWADTELVKLKDLYFSNTNVGDTTNAVGVPSLVAPDDEHLVFVYSTETPAQEDDFDGQPHVEALTLNLRGKATFPVFTAEQFPQHTERTEDIYANQVHGAGGFRFSGAFSASATTRISNGLAAARPTTGAYDFTFQDDYGTAIDLGHTDYVVLVTIESDTTPLDGFTAIVEDKASTGFGVRVRDDASVVQNMPLSVGVIVFEDRVREGWN